MAQEKTPSNAGGSAPGSAAVAGAPKRSRASWLLPVGAFLLGLVLGAVLIGVADLGGDDDPDVVATPDTEPDDDQPVAASPTPSDVAVVVPGPCLAAADRAEELSRQLDDVAAAVGSFDAQRLQELVDRFQQLQPEVSRQADACRARSGAGLREGTLVTPAPTPGQGEAPTPEPSP